MRAEFGLARDGYLAIDTGHAPGKGLVTDSIQYHGSADIYAIDADTRTLATISKDLGGPQTPALTVRTVGTMGGEVAAFAFDLPQSIVLTRQGNPQWAGQDRDGLAPIRPNDLFTVWPTAIRSLILSTCRARQFPRPMSKCGCSPTLSNICSETTHRYRGSGTSHDETRPCW